MYSSLAEIRPGYTRTTPVQTYGKKVDKAFWEAAVDTTGLKSGKYTLKISAFDAPITAFAEIELPNRSSLLTATQTPGFGFGILTLAIRNGDSSWNTPQKIKNQSPFFLNSRRHRSLYSSSVITPVFRRSFNESRHASTVLSSNESCGSSVIDIGIVVLSFGGVS